MKSTSNDVHHIAGYLLKKNKGEAWQKRYFETNNSFLTYYKSKKMSKLLAALNMASVGEIALVSGAHRLPVCLYACMPVCLPSSPSSV